MARPDPRPPEMQQPPDYRGQRLLPGQVPVYPPTEGDLPFGPQKLESKEPTPPQSGPVTGKAVAKDENHIAVATSANRFVVVEAIALGQDVQIGDRLSLNFSKGRPSVNNDRDRAR